LSGIPERYFEATGLLFGFSALVLILVQILAEITSSKPTSLSVTYVLGFFLVYSFWALYGLRFKRLAMWLTNGIAAVLQMVLLAIIMFKH
jgi:uncharacterized protein with PQ loop repeat